MNNRVLKFTVAITLFLTSVTTVFSQTEVPLFEIPDTICRDASFSPYNVINNAANYTWTSCLPELGNMPQGTNLGVINQTDIPSGISLAQDQGVYYSLNVNKNGSVYRAKYEAGLVNGTPSFVTNLGTVVNLGAGIYSVQDSGIWHSFVVGGNNLSNSKIVRFDFNNGLIQAPVTTDLGNLSGSLNTPKGIFIAKDNNNWFGFVITNNDHLVKLDFGSSLTNTPSVTDYSNVDNTLSGVSAITGVLELGNWHLFVTNRSSNSVAHIYLGNNLNNNPYAENLGTFDLRLQEPVGIAIAKSCNSHYAYVLSYGNKSITTLKWENVSVANTPTAVNYGDVGAFVEPMTLSNIMHENGNVIMYSANKNLSRSKILFTNCTSSQLLTSTDHSPAFSFSDVGVYTLNLIINDGSANVQSYCKQIIVVEHPDLDISGDQLICEGQTVNLQAQTHDYRSISWLPETNIDTNRGPSVNVSPTYNTPYIVTIDYNGKCKVSKQINVTVSKIKADAGPDRTISDGATTEIGGANTLQGDGYAYLWHPTLGIKKEDTLKPYALATPPYDITYYLLVVNSDGCSAIDSVTISVDCNDINLPNAFFPSSSNSSVNTFGIKNKQIAKLNYFSIYDRWGKQVFTTTNASTSWNGLIDSKKAPLGVYVWVVDGYCSNNAKRFRKSGNVTLIR